MDPNFQMKIEVGGISASVKLKSSASMNCPFKRVSKYCTSPTIGNSAVKMSPEVYCPMKNKEIESTVAVIIVLFESFICLLLTENGLARWRQSVLLSLGVAVTF